MAETTGKEPAKTEAATRTSPPAPREEAHPLLAFRDEMDRLFDDFLAGFALTPWRSLRPGAAPWRPFRRVFEQSLPAVDIAERQDEYRITAELPGMTDKDVEVLFTGDALTLKGAKKQEREEKEEGYVVSERRYGSFQRSFPLPEDADPERISASF